MNRARGAGIPNIILTGFMGTGKTSVGRKVAERLGRPFVDMDSVIESRQGVTISELFASQGEPHFRRIESELCRDLASRGSQVVATGGGALVSEDNLRIMSQSGIVICLTGRPDELRRRLAGSANRPMLDGPNGAQRLEELMESRASAYARIPHQVDTSGLSPDQVADRVVHVWDQQRTTLNIRGAQGEYQVVVGRGLLATTGQALRALGFSRQSALITDSNVAPLHAMPLVRSLVAAELSHAICLMPAGEEHKVLATVSDLYDRLIAARLERRDPVLALGGGVVGDVAGFCAATYLRGVPLVQLPTTLLAMIDSSVGGKAAVDHPSGKNLIGCFKDPHLVMADLDTLATLPQRQISNGMAEIIKHGIIADPPLFEALGLGIVPWHELVVRAIVVKKDVVETDPYEQGVRAWLNMGHTFGHALEACTSYAMQHGEAVSIGLAAAAHLSERLGIAEQGLADRIEVVLQRQGLPIRHHGLMAQDLVCAMGSDKKRRDGKLNFVLPTSIGQVVTTDTVPASEVLAAWEHVLS